MHHLALLPSVVLGQEVGVTVVDPTTQQLLQLVSLFGGALKAGAWFTAMVIGIVGLVFALRIFGQRIHDLIPDDSWADKPLWFLFDTKPGGVLLNGLTTCGVVLFPIIAAGGHLTPVVAGAALAAGIGASQVWGWVKDLLEWYRAKKPSVAPAQAAGLEAVKKPGSGVDA